MVTFHLTQLVTFAVPSLVSAALDEGNAANEADLPSADVSSFADSFLQEIELEEIRLGGKATLELLQASAGFVRRPSLYKAFDEDRGAASDIADAFQDSVWPAPEPEKGAALSFFQVDAEPPAVPRPALDQQAIDRLRHELDELERQTYPWQHAQHERHHHHSHHNAGSSGVGHGVNEQGLSHPGYAENSSDGSATGLLGSVIRLLHVHLSISPMLLYIVFISLLVLTAYALYKVLCNRVSRQMSGVALPPAPAEEPEPTVPGGKGATHDCVAAMPRYTSKDIQASLAKSEGYDCALRRPWSSGGPVRLEVRVQGAVQGAGPLQAPLSGQECVLYSAGVCQQTHDGMHPVSVAYASASVDFKVTLLDAPDVSIEVRGDDVLLFDQHMGRLTQTKHFNAAPDHWQVFAVTRRASILEEGSSGALSQQHRPNFVAENPSLEFQECALLVGASVTVVGELHQQPDCGLVLMPWKRRAHCKNPSSVSCTGGSEPELWRTSWERYGMDEILKPSAVSKERDDESAEADNCLGLPIGKVAISDSPELLEAATPKVLEVVSTLRPVSIQDAPVSQAATCTKARGSTLGATTWAAVTQDVFPLLRHLSDVVMAVFWGEQRPRMKTCLVECS